MEKTLIVVVGPTGIGKSAISLKLAQYLNTDIISADSRQIYRELSIGTAVPPEKDLNTVTHHFIQTISVNDYYNASMFETDVLKKLEQLFPSKNPVILTGGSMFYVDAVCNGIDDFPTVDQEIRSQLIEEFAQNGLEAIRLQLKQLDPIYYGKVDLKNPKRILHALEICLMTGKPYSSLRSGTLKERPFRIVKIGLNMERENLYKRINERVLQMVAQGLFEEARSVYHLKHLNPLNTVGYKEIFAYFDGTITRDEAIEQIQNNSRKYARKQLTWFRRDPTINWFEPQQYNEIINFLHSSNIL
ncbi:MAG: tRNA (adenosine(37)-N6)-dimethylallyltransferase MiaA [Prolixibacteraceae bacterium]|jgi:tRNA dimethylallyltransferase|nr:tRNA (adenosine(37)-N6)-dimethylallyltransferase MiaA [Prolixibacteraceae bacterium]